MTDYAVGDIQGCFKSLQRLLTLSGFMPGKDTLWITGDLVNRGPDSLGTLQFLKRQETSCRIVLGNHDLHLLAVYYLGLPTLPKDTLTQVLQSSEAGSLCDFLCDQPLIQHDKSLGYTMTHAGIPSIWSTKKAIRLADEVASVLRGPDKLAFFKDMYGNTPAVWQDKLTGTARLRTITNYFTRMRFTDSLGKLDLRAKNAPNKPPKGMNPWYAYSPVKPRKTTLLFGHWAALNGLFNRHDMIGLDTGCVWGGKLTMVNLSNREIIQYPQKVS